MAAKYFQPSPASSASRAWLLAVLIATLLILQAGAATATTTTTTLHHHLRHLRSSKHFAYNSLFGIHRRRPRLPVAPPPRLRDAHRAGYWKITKSSPLYRRLLCALLALVIVIFVYISRREASCCWSPAPPRVGHR